jgi:protein tyrosine/serine phosphatase
MQFPFLAHCRCHIIHNITGRTDVLNLLFLIVSGRRLFEEDNPLVISLEASVSNRNSKLILRDNTYSTIQWDAFTHPELNNFILILRREEELYMEKVRM